MTTINRFSKEVFSIPASTVWYLTDIGEFKGKQELYVRRSPQRLKALREHAIIESAVSSNRIEGVSIDPSRIKDVLVSPKPLFRDRDEEEVRGYRDALKRIHENYADMPVDEATILSLHRTARGDIWDAGVYKSENSDIIERYQDGRERIRFRTVDPQKTPEMTRGLAGDWNLCMRDKTIHPLIAIAFFNLDFLCIHPFRDGNGRVSRLLFLLQTYLSGYEVGRYISFERLIEENKERYYETLEESSIGWHEGKNNPWPYTNYLLSVLKLACRQTFDHIDAEQPQAGSMARGGKTIAVLEAIKRLPVEFTLMDLENESPGVSHDMVRRILKQNSGNLVECIGKGPGAKWRKKGTTL
jgi:Fic family protein